MSKIYYIDLTTQIYESLYIDLLFLKLNQVLYIKNILQIFFLRITLILISRITHFKMILIINTKIIKLLIVI